MASTKTVKLPSTSAIVAALASLSDEELKAIQLATRAEVKARKEAAPEAKKIARMASLVKASSKLIKGNEYSFLYGKATVKGIFQKMSEGETKRGNKATFLVSGIPLAVFPNKVIAA